MSLLYFFIQFAHTFRQLLEKGHSIVSDLKLKLKEVSVFILDSLTSKSSNLIEINLNFQLRFFDAYFCRGIFLEQMKQNKFCFAPCRYLQGFLLHR